MRNEFGFNFAFNAIEKLFRRLNSGGTPLSTLDLVAARLKGFDSRMEDLENEDIRINRDELIKLIMTLQDKFHVL